MKKALGYLAAISLILSISAMSVPAADPSASQTEAADQLSFESGIKVIDKYGNIILSITTDEVFDLGFEYGDVVTADIGPQSIDMPLCSLFPDVDSGSFVCLARTDGTHDGEVTVAINMGDLATNRGIAVKETTDDDIGYKWNYCEGYDAAMHIRVSMKEKGAYRDQYQLRELSYSDNREDFPDLTDEQYANFRCVTTTGTRDGVLYRSSSPVDPDINRNKEADAACRKHGIKTVINLVNSKAELAAFEGYESTYYSGCDIIPLSMNLDVTSAESAAKLADGLRFLAGHEGPYLVHCKEGKDRAGFASALLESLMGASYDEVLSDYMVSYYNYYGIVPGDERYEIVSRSNIGKILSTAFGVDEDDLDQADLAECAETFLKNAGMTTDEIDAVREKLA